MAGTTTSYKTDKIVLGRGKIYAKVAVPTTGGRITIDATTLTPDATANASAIHLGGTKAGATAEFTVSITEVFIDEIPTPVATSVQQVSGSIKGDLVGVSDFELLELLSPGFGTKSAGSGYEQLTIGTRPIVLNSIALIAPLYNDPTKIIGVQLYSAANSAGLSLNFAAKDLSFSPFDFKGYAVSGRPDADAMGIIWKTV